MSLAIPALKTSSVIMLDIMWNIDAAKIQNLVINNKCLDISFVILTFYYTTIPTSDLTLLWTTCIW